MEATDTIYAKADGINVSLAVAGVIYLLALLIKLQ